MIDRIYAVASANESSNVFESIVPIDYRPQTEEMTTHPDACDRTNCLHIAFSTAGLQGHIKTIMERRVEALRQVSEGYQVSTIRGYAIAPGGLDGMSALSDRERRLIGEADVFRQYGNNMDSITRFMGHIDSFLAICVMTNVFLGWEDATVDLKAAAIRSTAQTMDTLRLGMQNLWRRWDQIMEAHPRLSSVVDNARIYRDRARNAMRRVGRAMSRRIRSWASRFSMSQMNLRRLLSPQRLSRMRRALATVAIGSADRITQGAVVASRAFASRYGSAISQSCADMWEHFSTSRTFRRIQRVGNLVSVAGLGIAADIVAAYVNFRNAIGHFRNGNTALGAFQLIQGVGNAMSAVIGIIYAFGGLATVAPGLLLVCAAVVAITMIIEQIYIGSRPTAKDIIQSYVFGQRFGRTMACGNRIMLWRPRRDREEQPWIEPWLSSNTRRQLFRKPFRFPNAPVLALPQPHPVVQRLLDEEM